MANRVSYGIKKILSLVSNIIIKIIIVLLVSLHVSPWKKKEETSVSFDNDYNFCTTPQILTILLSSKLYQI